MYAADGMLLPTVSNKVRAPWRCHKLLTALAHLAFRLVTHSLLHHVCDCAR
jgi:hypothetical protein